MNTQICACEGLDSNCPNCFGSGYINVSESRQSAKKEPKTEKKDTSVASRIQSMTRAEVENAAMKIVADLDLKSKKQMQLLNSISFSTTTFRRDFKDKFQNLQALEDGKRFLRSELEIILRDTADKKYFKSFAFSHFLSDKDIDISSNRDLKGIIREHRKLKTDR